MIQAITLLFALVGLATAAHLSPNYLPPSGGGGRSFNNFGGGGGGGAGSQIAIRRFDNQNDGDGQYNYQYETANGISAQEQGVLRNAGSSNEGIAAQGSYSYTAPDGQQITVTYTADENGFRPQGAHLPTPPPIPDAILRSLEQNRLEESRGGYRSDEGQYNPGAGGQGGYSY